MYRDLTDEIHSLAEKLNWEYGDGAYRPVVFLNEYCGPGEIALLYRMAAGCVVSSLHDGMNLVAKEFVAARGDDRGALVLSRFTGAARELPDAVLVNPFDVDELADGMHLALTMPEDEQERRMRRMRAQVNDHNIFRWAGTLLSQIGKLVPEPPERVASPPDPAGYHIAQDDLLAATRFTGG